MATRILAIEVRFEQDVVLARQRARQIAGLLGFDLQDQVRIATAVSEIVRNAFQYAGGAKLEFSLSGDPRNTFQIRVRDDGRGIDDLNAVLAGQFVPRTGSTGSGIAGARRLMDQFQITSAKGQGTIVVLEKILPDKGTDVASRLPRIAEELARTHAENPFDEIQKQNQELLRALGELKTRQVEFVELNQELMETNRGIVALYAELDEKADSLKQASEMKSRFLSNMSHEFRTPLNSILGLSQFLIERMDGELTSEQEKQVTLIRKSANSLLEMVNDLLDLAKVEAGKVVIEPHDFLVSDLFSAMRGMFRPLLPNTGLVLTFDEPLGLPVLYTDEGKLAQVIRNFISNAIKFTPHGEIRVWAALDGDDGLRFFVKDTGIGIKVENQERIFEEFAQVSNSVQKHVKGTGLGLPLSRKLAELLGGSVAIHSELGVGSTFQVRIPVNYPGAAAVPSTVNPTELSESGRTEGRVLLGKISTGDSRHGG